MASTALLVMLAVGGCAPRADAVSAQLQEVQREISALRADNLIMKDRLETLEEEDEERVAAPVGQLVSDPLDHSDRPQLAVVRLSPEMADEVAPVGDAAVAGEGPEPLEIVGDARGVKQRKSAAAGAKGRTAPSSRRR